MPPAFSRTISGHLQRRSPAFAAASVDIGTEPAFTSPVLHIDHFRMSDVTFAPHPHAGFSAISYIFDDSPGSIRNRDSLGHDFVVGPGGIVWTQAGSGVVHDELPDVPGREVHGLQIFINLSSASKALAPAVFHHSAEELPVVTDAAGNRVKVVVGQWGESGSPLKPAEPVRFYDVLLAGDWEYDLAEGLNTMLYVAQGEVAVELDAEKRNLNQYEAVGISGQGTVRIRPMAGKARIVLIAGKPLHEPVAQYGPFVMNSREELQSAYARYQGGKMGQLEPLPRAGGM